MRALAPERTAHIIEDLGEKYGLDKLPEILNEMKTHQLESTYYREAKALIRDLGREGYNAKQIKKNWYGTNGD